jgi:hypothetical protein
MEQRTDQGRLEPDFHLDFNDEKNDFIFLYFLQFKLLSKQRGAIRGG